MWILDVVAYLALVGAPAVIGYRMGLRRGKRTPELPAALCSCGHGSGKHAAGGACSGGDFRNRQKYSSSAGTTQWDEWVTCACERYDGPDVEALRLLRGA